ncbi:phosphoribosyltransferase [Sulfurimonas sp. SAG-AH-194-I05]|nr:phosphoribosyltransferase family protein [Sulfurimonas sp. SAG-AH-194-I05]MDF1874240.1 phosphoribosyltransferase [Sulfurimonas sp. SAG-AH-194-I05]
MQYYSYENFKNDTTTLIEQVQVFKPEAIVGIARGGLTLAHCMAEGLEIRDVQTIRTELYDGTTKREKISVFGNCSFKENIKVLVVDDIADSGETLKAVMCALAKSHPSVVFESCTLFYKKSSCYEPHFWIHEAKDWIDFFWERDYT